MHNEEPYEKKKSSNLKKNINPSPTAQSKLCKEMGKKHGKTPKT
jgi:hypothetical protein